MNSLSACMWLVLEIISYSQKVPMDIDTWKMQEENILTAWQTPVSVRALIGWLQARGCRFKSWIFSSFTFFSNILLYAVKFKGQVSWPTGIQALPSSRYPNHIGHCIKICSHCMILELITFHFDKVIYLSKKIETKKM